MKFPGVPIRSILVEGPRSVCLANGQSVAVNQKSVPLGLKLHRAWGPIDVQSEVLVVMTANDSSLILVRVILERPEISPNTELNRITRVKLEGLFGVYRSGTLAVAIV